MPDNSTTALVKTAQSPALARVSNQLALTDKLLTKPEEPFLIPYRKGDKWGFCDRNKNIVIDCVWDKVARFSEGLAVVWTQLPNDIGPGTKRYRFIDYSGNVIAGGGIIEYGSVKNFSDGFALESHPYGHHFLSKKGIYLSFDMSFGEFSNAYPFSEGLASVEFENNKKYGFIDTSGNIAINPRYDFAYPFSESLALVADYRVGKQYFINRNGDVVLPISYEYSQSFVNGLSLVQSLNKKYGYINVLGEEVIPLIYDEADVFVNDLAAVRLDKKWMYINNQGDVILAVNYDNAHSFSQGLAAVEYNNPHFEYSYRLQFINKLGEQVISTDYITSYHDYEKKYVVFDCDHVNFLAEPSFGFQNGLILINRGYIDRRGTEYWEE